jgi:hypothetical protein
MHSFHSASSHIPDGANHQAAHEALTPSGGRLFAPGPNVPGTGEDSPPFTCDCKQPGVPGSCCQEWRPSLVDWLTFTHFDASKSLASPDTWPAVIMVTPPGYYWTPFWCAGPEMQQPAASVERVCKEGAELQRVCKEGAEPTSRPLICLYLLYLC